MTYSGIRKNSSERVLGGEGEDKNVFHVINKVYLIVLEFLFALKNGNLYYQAYSQEYRGGMNVFVVIIEIKICLQNVYVVIID